MKQISFISNLSGLRRLLAIVYLILFASNAPANEAKNFSAVAPGVIRDSLTDLEWMRCSLGQEWNEKSSTCTGEVEEFKWKKAVDYVQNLNAKGGYANRRDWRIPTIRELVSIRYCSNSYDERFTGLKDGKGGVPLQCASDKSIPTVVHSVFPETVATSYWADSSEDINWMLNFSCGYIIFQHGVNAWLYRVFNSYPVRLVRDSPRPVSFIVNK